MEETVPSSLNDFLELVFEPDNILEIISQNPVNYFIEFLFDFKCEFLNKFLLLHMSQLYHY